MSNDYIKQEFAVIFEIKEIGSIKAWKAGVAEGVKFPPSVKFRATNIQNKEDIDVGVREIETICDFQVKVETSTQTIQLMEQLRKFRVEKKPIFLSGELPNKTGADNILVIKSTETLEDFLKRNKMNLSVPTEKK